MLTLENSLKGSFRRVKNAEAKIVIKVRFTPIGALLIVVLFLTVGHIAQAQEPPSLPSSFYGNVIICGVNASDVAEITTWINGVQYGDPVMVSTWDSNTVYTLDIPPNDPATSVIEEGINGETIVFKVDGQVTDQTGTWQSGTNVELQLTVSGPPCKPASVDIASFLLLVVLGLLVFYYVSRKWRQDHSL